MIFFEIPDQRYEYDVRALTNEFFPGSKPASQEVLRVTETPEGYRFCFGERERFCVVAQQEQTERKRRMKRALYDFLGDITEKTLPWGALTGIRPTKLVRTMLDAGDKPEAVLQTFQEEYRVSEEKAHLALQVAEKERQILSSFSTDADAYSVYVGIPFCPSRCLYCSFTSFPIEKWEQQVDGYLDALCREIEETAFALPHRKPDSIYIGGGTPTTLSAAQLERLLSKLASCFDVSSIKEGCVECGRPDSITREKLCAIRDAGFIGRISINPQTMNQETLDLIGRRHTVEDVIEKFAMAREIGFQNINMDLIAGLPGEGAAQMRHTLEAIEKLMPDDLTVHALALKRAAALRLHMEEYEAALGREITEQMEIASEAVARMGLEPYYLYRQKNMAGNFENVGYARPGREGIYNILIMEEVQTILAFGAGAISKFVYPDAGSGVRIQRAENPKDIKQYMERIVELIEKKITGIKGEEKGL